MFRFTAALLCLIGSLYSGWARADRVVHARVDRASDVYDVGADLTFVRTTTEDMTLFTDRALRWHDRAESTFYPARQTLEVVEAWVDQPDGARVTVEPSGIFTRPSAASRSAPGFVDSQTTTVLFPRLTHGSRTHIVWREVQKTPALLGFNTYNLGSFEWDTVRDETRINLPADVPLHWTARGGYRVTDTVESGVRHIAAAIENIAGRDPEPAMVSQLDFMPVFIATSLPSSEAIGAIVHAAASGRAAVTPEIQALADRIAGDLTGLDAARAVHAWVARNIRYIAVWLDPNDGWVPHAAAEVLKAGYGDCKDYVVLMRALLAARGIEAEMAVVDWGDRYGDPPVGVPYYNHAILYLPAHDLYVNPTDRDAVFGALDKRLAGKPVVIVTKTGAVGRIPPAVPAAYRYRHDAHATLNLDASVDGAVRYAFSPDMETPVRGWLRGASSTKDLARRMLAWSPEGGFGDFASSDPEDLLHPLTLSGTWHSPHVVALRDGDIYLRVPLGPDMYSPARLRDKLSPEAGRRTPEVGDVIDAHWDVAIALESGFAVSRLPPDVDVTTSAGRYSARYRASEEGIQVSRSLIVGLQVVPPEAYPDLERLIYQSQLDARAVIVLTRGAR